MIKGLLFFLYLILVFFLLYKNEYLSSKYDFSIDFIPTISFISVIYIGYRYLVLYVKADSLEDEFTSIVNHTFRTPLTRIMWMTKELEKDMPQNERLLYLQNISNATDKVLEVVDLIVGGSKDINSKAGYNFEAVSVRALVEKSIAKYREEITKKNITFQIPTFADMPMLTVDLKKISFVIDTVIENAVFYTPQGGKILIGCVKTKRHLTLSVADNGLGLNLIDKMRIFSRFFRSKKALLLNTDGMGLRLYLSRQIMKRHHGRIHAKSGGRNKGAVFFIELPFN